MDVLLCLQSQETYTKIYLILRAKNIIQFEGRFWSNKRSGASEGWV